MPLVVVLLARNDNFREGDAAMSMEQLVATGVLIGLLGIAVVSDIRRHRIPNLLILVGLALD